MLCAFSSRIAKEKGLFPWSLSFDAHCLVMKIPNVPFYLPPEALENYLLHMLRFLLIYSDAPRFQSRGYHHHYWYIWSSYSFAFAPSLYVHKQDKALGADQGVFQFFFSWDKGANGYLYISFHFFPDQILALFSFRYSFIYHESHDVTDCCFSNS